MKRLIGVTLVALALFMVVGCGKSHRQSEQPAAPAEIQLEQGMFTLDANSVNVMFTEGVTEDKIEQARTTVENFRQLNNTVEFANGDLRAKEAQLAAIPTGDAQRAEERNSLSAALIEGAARRNALAVQLEDARRQMTDVVASNFSKFEAAIGLFGPQLVEVRYQIEGQEDVVDADGEEATFDGHEGRLSMSWSEGNSVFAFVGTQKTEMAVSVDKDGATEPVVRISGRITKVTHGTMKVDGVDVPQMSVQHGLLTLIKVKDLNKESKSSEDLVIDESGNRYKVKRDEEGNLIERQPVRLY